MRKMQLQAVDAQGFADGKIGIFKELGGAKVLHDNGDSRHTRVRVVAPRDFKEWETINALYGKYYYSCNHEHDCCGCVFSYVSDFKRTNRRREYLFTLVESRNV